MNDNTQTAWSSEDWKRELTDIFFARRAMIVTITLVVLAAALLITLFWPPTYRAEASILVRGKKPQINPGMLERTDIRPPSISEEDVASELHILGSSELVRRTLLKRHGQPQEANLQGAVEADDAAAAVGDITARLETEMMPSSNVIRVTYSAKDPEHAESMLNDILSEYLTYRSLVFSPSEETAFLTDRAQYYSNKLQEKEDEILALAKQGNVALIDKEMQNNSELKKVLGRQLANAKVEYAKKWKTLDPLEQAVEEEEDVQMFAFLENEAMNRLGEQLIILIQQREDAARNFMPTTPKIKALDQQIERTYALLRNEARHILVNLRNEVESLAIEIDKLEESIQKLSERNVELQSAMNAKKRLEREIAFLENSYETYSRRSEGAQISSAIADASLSSDVTILSNASHSAEKVFPDLLMTPLIGLVAGFILACSLAFVTEYLDHTLKRPSEVERLVGLPVICSIPKI